MHATFFAVLLFIIGCAAVPSQAGENQRTMIPSNPEADYYTDDELRALGLRIVPVDTKRSLLCSKDDRFCVCREPLPCEAEIEKCISFKENIRVFRSALAGGQGGRKVVCRRGEIGRCGNFQYFDFVGDIERHETRWFDATGRLVSQRNRTDYPAYCDGRSRIRLMGRIPKCPAMQSGERICGDAKGEASNAIDNLLAPTPRQSAQPESKGRPSPPTKQFD